VRNVAKPCWSTERCWISGGCPGCKSCFMMSVEWWRALMTCWYRRHTSFVRSSVVAADCRRWSSSCSSSSAKSSSAVAIFDTARLSHLLHLATTTAVELTWCQDLTLSLWSARSLACTRHRRRPQLQPTPATSRRPPARPPAQPLGQTLRHCRSQPR